MTGKRLAIWAAPALLALVFATGPVHGTGSGGGMSGGVNNAGDNGGQPAAPGADVTVEVDAIFEIA